MALSMHLLPLIELFRCCQTWREKVQAGGFCNKVRRLGPRSARNGRRRHCFSETCHVTGMPSLQPEERLIPLTCSSRRGSMFGCRHQRGLSHTIDPLPSSLSSWIMCQKMRAFIYPFASPVFIATEIVSVDQSIGYYTQRRLKSSHLGFSRSLDNPL